MLECSLGKITEAIVRKSLSGFTFVEMNVPVESYADSPKFTVTIDDLQQEYTLISSEVFMQPDTKVVIKAVGVLSTQADFLKIHPMSCESADASDLLKSLGIENGPSRQTTFVNLFLSSGQLAIVLANMTPKTAFVDFENKTVVYYTELYKQKAIQVESLFRRIYSRAPIAGYVGWDSNVTGLFPTDTQAVMSFGQFTNTDKTIMENVLNNCNEIATIFSDMQMFTTSTVYTLGTTVLSNLTSDKKIIVGAEEHYNMNSQVTAIYYCV